MKNIYLVIKLPDGTEVSMIGNISTIADILTNILNNNPELKREVINNIRNENETKNKP
jgi:hypothetical protein